MDSENDKTRQQLETLERRRILEQKRADYLNQRRHELEEKQREKEQATKDRKAKQQDLRQQCLLAQRMLRGDRAA